MRRALGAALVDVGGTLWPDRWPNATRAVYLERLLDALPALGTSRARRLLATLEEKDPGRQTRLSLQQDTPASIAAALRTCEVEEAGPAMVDLVLSRMDVPAKGVIDLFPGASDLLHTIKSLGLRCVVVSNATYRSADSYTRDFRELGVAQHIDAVVSSADLGYRKPSMEIFRAALEAARSDAAEAVVIGDSEDKDIRPARRLGMRTILVAVENPPPAVTQADATARSLEDAAATLSGWV